MSVYMPNIQAYKVCLLHFSNLGFAKGYGFSVYFDQIKRIFSAFDRDIAPATKRTSSIQASWYKVYHAVSNTLYYFCIDLAILNHGGNYTHSAEQWPLPVLN